MRREKHVCSMSQCNSRYKIKMHLFKLHHSYQKHHLRFTLAAELDTPWVTLRMRPPTLPYLMSSDMPSVTSLRRPIGFPRKSTEPRIWAAWLMSSFRESKHSDHLQYTLHGLSRHRREKNYNAARLVTL